MTAGEQRCDTRAGAKPGDPLADVIFCFSFAVMVARIRQEASLILSFRGAGVFKLGEVVSEVSPPPISYMDDLVFVVPANSPEQLLERLAVVATIAVKVSR